MHYFSSKFSKIAKR